MPKSTTHLWFKYFLFFLNNLAISQVLVFVIWFFKIAFRWNKNKTTTRDEANGLKQQIFTWNNTASNPTWKCKKPTWNMKRAISLIYFAKKYVKLFTQHCSFFVFLAFLFLMQAIKLHSGTTRTKKNSDYTPPSLFTFLTVEKVKRNIRFVNFAESNSKFFFGFVKKISSTNESILLAWMKNNQHNVVSLPLLSHFQSSVLSLTCHSFCDTFNLKSEISSQIIQRKWWKNKRNEWTQNFNFCHST